MQIPATLGSVLESKFVGSRLPLVTDNLEYNINYNKSHGGTGCLGVAVGDFDGNGAKDVVVGLTPKAGGKPVVVVALASGIGWKLHPLESWVDHRSRLYVGAVPPGRVERTPAADGPLELGERKSMMCANEGVVVGATESTAIVYGLLKAKWAYVWASD